MTLQRNPVARARVFALSRVLRFGGGICIRARVDVAPYNFRFTVGVCVFYNFARKLRSV